MTERLLQFIWQFQYFNRHELLTCDGAVLQIIHPGKYNTNQGPDFLEASIKIDNTILVGNIELHVQASDWLKHGHQTDSNYKNIILHVVWRHDGYRIPNAVPALDLEARVPALLLRQYNDWMLQASPIPCASAIKDINELVWLSWTDRLLAERLQRKSDYVLTLLSNNHYHWEETCWQLLAKNFGIQVNADAFEAIARTLPLSILARHKNQVPVLEALLLGQAGLLHASFTDSYAQLLHREYQFHFHKYKLAKPPMPVYFLRMRPAAFPTIRLAQLAMLLHQRSRLFAFIKDAASVQEVKQLLTVQANDYWHYHYKPGEPADYSVKKLGSGMVDNIIINTVIPLLFAYGLYHKDVTQQEKALAWMAALSPEKNTITREWQKLNIANNSAHQSQALIELTTQYCHAKRCLDCSVGNALLKRKAIP